MNKIIKLIAFSSIFLFLNCNSTKHFIESNVLIELEKTNCSGPCPIYTLKIATNGDIIIDGKANIAKIGRYKSKLSHEQLDTLIREFETIKFFELKDTYTSLMMDLPTNYISYTKNGQTKKIKAYDNVPKPLMSLINKIDTLATNLNWTKIR